MGVTACALPPPFASTPPSSSLSLPLCLSLVGRDYPLSPRYLAVRLAHRPCLVRPVRPVTPAYLVALLAAPPSYVSS